MRRSAVRVGRRAVLSYVLMNERDEAVRPSDEWAALLRIGGWLALIGGWGLWLLSLPIAQLMLFAFDSEVSQRDGAILGAIQATWITGIPVALLVLQHLAANGFVFPEWRLRWIVVVFAASLWALIFGFWLFAAASDDDDFAHHQILSSMSSGRSS
jgi:hypothetical protein